MEKKKRKITANGTGLKWMDELWRRAVRYIFGYRCFFCGAHINSVPLECHHIIKRKNFLTKFSYRDGVLLCKFPNKSNEKYKMSCHAYAETPAGKKLINDYLIGKDYMDYLMSRSGSCKQYFVDNNISRTEYLLEIKKELLDILEEENDEDKI